jgi:hypothetical protein
MWCPHCAGATFPAANVEPSTLLRDETIENCLVVDLWIIVAKPMPHSNLPWLFSDVSVPIAEVPRQLIAGRQKIDDFSHSDSLFS